MDTVKVRMQAQHVPYTSSWKCFTQVLRYEGARGLYRGLSPQLVGGALETGINYAVYQHMLGVCAEARLPPAAAVPLSAGAAGVALPAELVKCRLQLGATDPHHYHAGPMQCLRHLVQTEGLRGLTRGLGSTMARRAPPPCASVHVLCSLLRTPDSREVPGNATYFAAYAALRRAVGGAPPERSQPRSAWRQAADAGSAILCGGLAGMLMWALVLPVDVAKTRVQTAYPGSPYDVGILKQMRMLHREGGVGSLYSGLGPTLVRAFPANAAQWLVWELCTDRLQRSGGGS
eukprot:scaffold1.g5789.t1